MSQSAHAFGTAGNKLPKLLVLFLAETLGTFILECFGCMGVCVSILNMPVVPHLSALSFGLAVMISIQIVGHISGCHINPQVTLGAVILEKLKPTTAVVYVLGQFVGAILGYGLLYLLVPPRYVKNSCITIPHNHLTVTQGVLIEITITFTLILFLGAVLDPRNANKMDSMSLRFGLAVAGISMVSGPYTSASMNTARSFAPSLINNKIKVYSVT